MHLSGKQTFLHPLEKNGKRSQEGCAKHEATRSWMRPVWERCGVKQKHLETGERRLASGRQQRSQHWNSNCCLPSRRASNKVSWWQVQNKYMEVISYISYSSPCKHLSIRWYKCWKFLWFKVDWTILGGRKLMNWKLSSTKSQHLGWIFPKSLAVEHWERIWRNSTLLQSTACYRHICGTKNLLLAQLMF